MFNNNVVWKIDKCDCKYFKYSCLTNFYATFSAGRVCESGCFFTSTAARSASVLQQWYADHQAQKRKTKA